MSSKHLQLKNDYGQIDIDEAMLMAVEKIQDAAWQLQMTPGELITILLESPTLECPCCAKEAKN